MAGMQWHGLSPNYPRSYPLKTALALIAVLLLAACAAGEPAGSAAAPIKYDTGTVIDSQGATVTTGKF